MDRDQNFGARLRELHEELRQAQTLTPELMSTVERKPEYASKHIPEGGELLAWWRPARRSMQPSL
jgi:hypothetical protein